MSLTSVWISECDPMSEKQNNEKEAVPCQQCGFYIPLSTGMPRVVPMFVSNDRCEQYLTLEEFSVVNFVFGSAGDRTQGLEQIRQVLYH